MRGRKSPSAWYRVGILALCLIAWQPVAVGDDIFGDLFRAIGRAVAPRRAAPARVQVQAFDQIRPEPGLVNQFMPHLQKVLTAELHFVKKVCDPDEKQFETIHRAGAAASTRVAKLLQQIEQSRSANRQWPNPHQLIAEELLSAVESVMDDATSEDYRRELELRWETDRQAALNAVILAVDDELLLSLEQIEPVSRRIEDNWKADWQNPLRLVMYGQYIDLPEAQTLESELTELQYRVLDALPPRPNIRFGWQTELGFHAFVGGGDLEPFPPLRNDAGDGQGGEQQRPRRPKGADVQAVEVQIQEMTLSPLTAREDD